MSHDLVALRQRQAPALLPVVCLITPAPDVALVVDGVRRYRGALELRTLLLAADDRHVEFALGPRRGGVEAWVEVVVEADGRVFRSSDLSLWSEGAVGGSGRAVAEWMLPLPDDVSAVSVRFASAEIDVRRVVHLDPDALRSALDDVWEPGQSR